MIKQSGCKVSAVEKIRDFLRKNHISGYRIHHTSSVNGRTFFRPKYGITYVYVLEGGGRKVVLGTRGTRAYSRVRKLLQSRRIKPIAVARMKALSRIQLAAA